MTKDIMSGDFSQRVHKVANIKRVTDKTLMTGT